MRIAAMQPYLWPYAGYFRLFARTDLLVILDDVQHIRRGWVHRNKLTNRMAVYDWLTLPIKSCPRNTLIKDLEFADNANELWRKSLRKFPLFDEDGDDWRLFGKPCEYIVKNLEAICKTLMIPWNVVRSSTIPSELKRQDRILALCKHFGATEYVNSPGGKNLYDADAFRLNGIQLTFLPQYPNKKSILQRVCTENIEKIQEEINAFS